MTEERPAPEPPPTPRWKRILLTVAVLSIVFGLVLEGVAFWGSDDATPMAASSGGGQPAAFVAPGTVGPAAPAPQEAPSGLPALAPLFLKGGFSFVIAYAIGSVLRTFVKLGLLLLGIVALGAMLLAYFDVVTIDWVDIEGQWNDLARLVGGHVDDFTRFVTGSLPSTAAAVGGLLVGVKRS